MIKEIKTSSDKRPLNKQAPADYPLLPNLGIRPAIRPIMLKSLTALALKVKKASSEAIFSSKTIQAGVDSGIGRIAEGGKK